MSFQPNKIKDFGDYIEISLSKGLSCKVDKEDYGIVAPHRWCAVLNGKLGKKSIRAYAITKNKKTGGKRMKMHTLILGKKTNLLIDHTNGDSLDNRRKNLRHAQFKENIWNKFVKGYSFHKRDKVWTARITVSGEKIVLGTFKTEALAKEARNDAVKKYHGRFAYQR